MSALNLTQLETILALPCVLAINDIFEHPILTKAICFGTNEYMHEIMTHEDLPTFLARVHNGAPTYAIDCSIFAQLAALVLADKWPIKGGHIFLYIADEVGGRHLWSSKIPQLGYITVSDPEVAETLQKAPLIDKGQWAIQVGDNKFLGLSKDGPRVFTMEQWVIRIRDSLEAFSLKHKGYIFPGPHTPESMLFGLYPGILACYFGLDLMNEWSFYTSPDKAAIKSTWTPEGVVVEIQEDPSELIQFLRLAARLGSTSTDQTQKKLRKIIANTLFGSAVKPKGIPFRMGVSSNGKHMMKPEKWVDDETEEPTRASITISKSQGSEWPYPVQITPHDITSPITSRALRERHRMDSATGVRAVRDVLSLQSPYFLLGRHDRDRNAWAIQVGDSLEAFNLKYKEYIFPGPHTPESMQFDYKYIQARRLDKFRSDVIRVTDFNPSRIKVDEERMKREHPTRITSMPRSLRASDRDRREVYPHQQEIIDAVKSMEESFDSECVTAPPRGDGRNGYGALPQSLPELGPRHKRAIKRFLGTPGLLHRALREADTSDLAVVLIALAGYSPMKLITDRGTIIISKSGSSPMMGSAMDSIIGMHADFDGDIPAPRTVQRGIIGMHADFDGDELIPADRAGQHGLITPSRYHQNPLLSFRSIPRQLKSSRIQARELLRRRQQKKAKYRGRLTKINHQRLNSGKH